VDEKLEKEFWETAKNIGEIKRTPDHPVVEFFSNQRIDFIKKYTDFNSVNSALDLGCGTGFSSFHFPSKIKLIGLDFSYRNLSINPLKNKVQASAYMLPFKSDSFDLIYCWDFLHHLKFLNKVIVEMMRVTRKYLILFEPNRDNPIQYLYGLFNRQERGTLKSSKKNLLKLINIEKFQINACESVGWLFAGVSPKFSLNLVKYLPFSHRLGISIALICEKRNVNSNL